MQQQKIRHIPLTHQALKRTENNSMLHKKFKTNFSCIPVNILPELALQKQEFLNRRFK